MQLRDISRGQINGEKDGCFGELIVIPTYRGVVLNDIVVNRY